MTASPDGTLDRDRLEAEWAFLFPVFAGRFAAVHDYYRRLQEANRLLNLYSRKLPAELLWKDHILDCAMALSFFASSSKILDFGSGGGLPGAVLAACFPDKRFVLLDKSTKKTHHLGRMLRELDLKNAVAVSEPDAAVLRGVDTLTARAMGCTAEVLALAEELPLGLHVRRVLYKGRRERLDEELRSVDSGRYLVSIHALQMPGGDRERHIVEIVPL